MHLCKKLLNQTTTFQTFGKPKKAMEENKVNAWEMWLTDAEREILGEKLKPREGESLSETFNSIVVLSDDHEIIKESVVAIRNVTDVLGGHKKSKVWEEVNFFYQIFPDKNHMIELHVKDRERFVAAMTLEKDYEGREKYAVNNFWDKKFANHPNDSVRQRTEFSTDHPIHLANDNSANLLAYYIHFDPASPYFRTTTHDGTESFIGSISGIEHLTEIKWAAEQHEKVWITPSDLRKHLKDTGQISEE